MIKDTSLCMGCMNDKTYDGPCHLCGYSDDMPYIPTYLQPKTFLADRYIVGKMISYNGEGAVYIGFDTAARVKVTIKEYMPDTLCTRKKGEAEITVNPDKMPLYKTYLSEFTDLNRTLMKSRGMSHLQSVLDVFCENNTAYAVFEFINGISLKTYIANSGGELTWDRIKELFPPIFTTLGLVHGAGLIHRGISPSTIFVTEKMELKLAGFCISAARTTGTEIACEIFAGYAAPEQYTSNNWNGTWTDVYGIAAVLYRCLTGCMPTEAIARTSGSLLEPMMINRNIPANVSKVIMSGLALSTDSRIRTINEFVDKLFEQPKYVGLENSSSENGKPAAKVPSKKLKKQQRERAKTIAVLVAAGLVLIGFVVVFIMTLNGAFSPQNNPQSGASNVQQTAEAPETAEIAPPVTESTTAATEPSVPDNANIALPDFTNRRYESTVTRYEGVFTFVPTYEYSNEYTAGFMYGQNIEAGTLVAEGITVEIKVSKGASLVALPEYTNIPIAEYIAELSKLNIKYSVENERTNDAENGTVARCSKEIGDLVNVEEGETITVYVAENYEETAETVIPEETLGIPVFSETAEAEASAEV